MRVFSYFLLSALFGLAACDEAGPASNEHVFVPQTRLPRQITNTEARSAALSALKEGESLQEFHVIPAVGIGQTVVEAIVGTGSDWRAFVVDEDGKVEETQRFWNRERAARIAHFGRMTPELYSRQAVLAPTDTVDVTIMLRADVPAPQLPFDGTDVRIPSSTYQDWFDANADAQLPLIHAAKQRVRGVLLSNGVTILEDPVSLPLLRAEVPATLLRSNDLNADDVVRIDPTPTPGHLLGFATEAAMNAGALSGGVCGGLCNGDHIGVGLWERDASGTVTSGIAVNSARIASSVFAYDVPLTTCTSDTDCVSTSDVDRNCESPRDGNGCTTTADCASGHTCMNGWCVGPKVCVQDHLTWVAASVGMAGAYDYATTVPNGVLDPTPNVPTGPTSIYCTTNSQCPSGEICNATHLCVTQFPANTGAWYVNFKVGNDNNQAGLDFLTSTSGGPATPFINHSYSGTPYYIDWPGRAFGTFVTAAAGDTGGSANVTCSRLKNGLCVGWYDYNTYNDLTSHRRTALSNYINDPGVDSTLERPHLLGPGNHTSSSGLHLPSINVAPGGYEMRWGDSSGGGVGGSSFSAPAVLSAAIQAQQYEGWFSNLAYPMVNKAVLLASTQDANADGVIGKSTTWSSQPSDAEDGAGQLNFGYIKQILDNNTYYFADLADSNFASCGAGCRKVTVANIAIPAQTGIRVALAWQSCLINEIGNDPVMSNDLDLALNCGSFLQTCGGTISSNAISSEVEMLEKAPCTFQRSCSIEIRIKNGATLQPCGSTTTERVGVAWAYHY